MHIPQRPLILASLLPLLGACSSGPQLVPTGSGGGNTGTTAGSSGGLPPPDGVGDVVFAIRRLYLGDTDPDGTPDLEQGWTHYGFDIDGKDWSVAVNASESCKQHDGAPLSALLDGNAGADNSFGHNLLPVFLGISSDLPARVNASIEEGEATTLIILEKLGTGSDYAPIRARLYAAAPLGKPPAFDGSDAWPVRPELLGDPTNIASAKVTTTTSYLQGNVWYARFDDTELSLPLLTSSGVTFHLRISRPTIMMPLDTAHATVSHGALVGVIATDSLIEEIKTSSSSLLDPSLCSAQGYLSLIDPIARASDIMIDGLQDPTKTCDGISIALGFDATLAKLGPIAAPEPPPAPCSTMP